MQQKVSGDGEPQSCGETGLRQGLFSTGKRRRQKVDSTQGLRITRVRGLGQSGERNGSRSGGRVENERGTVTFKGIDQSSDGGTRRNIFTQRLAGVWSEMSETVREAGSIERLERESDSYPERRNMPRLHPPLNHYIPLPSFTATHSLHSLHPTPRIHDIPILLITTSHSPQSPHPSPLRH